MERSITQATPGDGASTGAAAEPADALDPDAAGAQDEKVRLPPFVWGIALIVLCLLVFVFTNPNRQNPYVHFVWQAQAFLDGQTSIATHVSPSATSPSGSSRAPSS